MEGVEMLAEAEPGAESLIFAPSHRFHLPPPTPTPLGERDGRVQTPG